MNGGVLLDWVSEIVVKAGSDRAAEAIWRHVCYCVGNGRISPPASTGDVLQKTFQLDKLLTAEFGSRVARNGTAAVSRWDQWWTGVHDHYSISATLNVTVSANLFATAWGRLATDLPADVLRELAAFVRDNVDAFDLRGVAIETPGLWSLRYPTLLHDAVMRLNDQGTVDPTGL